MDSASEDEFRTPRKVKPEAESAPEITPEKAAEIGKEQQATDRCKTGNDSFAVALYESCKNGKRCCQCFRQGSAALMMERMARSGLEKVGFAPNRLKLAFELAAPLVHPN